MPGLRLPSGRTVDVRDGFIIGVDAGCDLRLVDPQAAARHVILQRLGEDDWQAATLSMGAPTEINGVSLTGLARLNDGDLLKVGGTDLRWLLITPAAAVASPLWARTNWSDLLLAAIVLAVLLLAVWQQGRWRQPIIPTPTATLAPTLLPAGAMTVTATCRPPLYRLIVPAPATATPTAIPPVTPSPGPSPTPTPSPTPSPSASPTTTPTRLPLLACPIPDGWVKKVVRQDETLPSLAQRYGVRVARLRRANCLPDNQIKWGQILYVPRQ